MIEIQGLFLSLGQFHLKDINLTIGDGEYFVILGPTGAGKTVLLECLAGLHHIKNGKVLLDGTDITNQAPEERNVGYVPQDYVLFPFLNVEQNIAFGLKRAGFTPVETAEKVLKLATMTGIPHLLKRDSRTLSGGEKQRAAMSRALATSPKLLLLDEPMGALDLRTARYLRMELRRLHQELGLTTVHITHDMMEALEMADRVAVIQDGTVEQVSGPQEMLFAPEGERVADFIGSPNIFEVEQCRDLGQGIMEVVTGGLKLTVPHDGVPVQKVAILPRHVYISETRPPGLTVNGFEGVVTSLDTRMNTVRIRVDVAGTNLMAEIPSYLFEEMDLAEGQEVFIILRMRRIRCYECR